MDTKEKVINSIPVTTEVHITGTMDKSTGRGTGIIVTALQAVPIDERHAYIASLKAYRIDAVIALTVERFASERNLTSKKAFCASPSMPELTALLSCIPSFSRRPLAPGTTWTYCLYRKLYPTSVLSFGVETVRNSLQEIRKSGKTSDILDVDIYETAFQLKPAVKNAKEESTIETKSHAYCAWCVAQGFDLEVIQENVRVQHAKVLKENADKTNKENKPKTKVQKPVTATKNVKK